MNKKELTKAIREVSDKLPPFKEEHVSGFTHDNQTNYLPHKYFVDVNHERRLRKAYESYGMEGIKRYLDNISKIQKQRNEQISKENAEIKTEHVPLRDGEESL